VLGGAAVVFFAYIGFDIVATTAEETRNPQSDMPVGIIGSLAIVTVLYVLVSAVITGMVPFGELAGETPVAEAFAAVEMPVVTIIVFAGALLALFKTTLLLMLGQTRVAFTMARDRLLPVVSVLTVVMSGALIATLGAANFIRFGVWFALGVVVYFAYSRPRSTVGRRGEASA
jgi:amino acid transporter